LKSTVDRKTVDLAAFPDLIVIYLGLRLRSLRGFLSLIRLGPQIDKAGGARPEGLLHFENGIIFNLFPLHVGMRWYWKDFEAMEKWARSEPHRLWWQTLSSRLGRHRVLARDLLHARWHGGRLR